jgi:hypothetical protein
MDFEFSVEEQDLKELFAHFFDQESPTGVVRAAEPIGFDRDLWDKIRLLGVPGLGDNGSDDPALVSQLSVIAEQAGYHLAPVPVVETFVALRYLTSLDRQVDPSHRSELPHGLVAPVRDGDVILSLALADALSMPEQMIPAGAIANYVVGLRGDSSLLVQRSKGLIQEYGRVHGSTPIAMWSLESAALFPGLAAELHARAVAEWQSLMAAALNGLSRHALEIGTAYATERKAFGKPIGTFQGVAHPLAEHATALSGSELLAHKAAWALDQNSQEGITLSTMAFAFAAELSSKLTASAVHIHGGYGAALEYDIQLFHQRAKAWANIGGRPSDHFVAVGSRLHSREQTAAVGEGSTAHGL